MRAGKGMLEIVLQNVLENATSFSPQGGTIALTLVQGRGIVQFQVDDEGPGIPPERIDRVFERYFSSRPVADNGRDGAEGGTDRSPPAHAGLGLWIVRRNVEALGGEVRANNRVGGGLSVTIVLPRNGD